MFTKSLFRNVFAINLAFTSNVILRCRAASTMAVPPQNFTLDRRLWNEDLYARMRNFWFEALPEGASTANMSTAQRWFGVGKSDEEKAQFDQQCSNQFGDALKSIGPDKIELPPFKSYEAEIADASDLSRPFLSEVKEAQSQDEQKGAETLLSLLLLLDQMSRNIHRDPVGLGLVYKHYDRLAFALTQAAMRLDPNPINHPCYKLRPAFRAWYLLPLMHAEHLPSHDLFGELTSQWREQVAAAGDQEAVDYLDLSMSSREEHLEPLRKFGRYPYRNDYVGRTTTPEEEEYLKTAKTFGVKTKNQAGSEAEGKKDEL